jgi:GH3 auxin-responsive promoter
MRAWQNIRSAIAGARERAFAAMRDTERTQRAQLSEILAQNRDTAFGRAHEFGEIRGAREYAQAVPLQTYESLEPYIDSNGLTAAVPVAFERTGGSTAGPKLIPYTQAGLDAFARAVQAWLEDLLLHRPGIMSGRCYWSISPAARAPERTRSGTPIGLDSDAAYFGQTLESSLARLLIAPAGGEISIEAWRAATVAALSAAPDLTLISVWSPTFLLQLLRHFPEEPRLLWPQLDTISCWTSGASASSARELAAAFPGVYLQGKGLLATEGVVSIPFAEYPYPALAVESGYYEFLDGQGVAHPAFDLALNAEYEVVMTTHSGLYRYRLGDRVAVRGWWGESAPLLEFLGRAGAVSDLCGEKLSESFVLPRLDRIAGFRLLTPAAVSRPGYILFLDASEYDAAAAAHAASQLDRDLRANPQYDYARRLGQLCAVIPVRVPGAMERYYEYLGGVGRRLGDIKPPGFHPHGDWLSVWYEYLPVPLRSGD